MAAEQHETQAFMSAYNGLKEEPPCKLEGMSRDPEPDLDKGRFAKVQQAKVLRPLQHRN